ncbi:MAG: SIMPL domain-containing protein [Halomonas sp.]|uniref:SIMPL domain-containing protein n=1 Tax=Halomonas sp. TaxID=1486246 RepID=UPI003F923013
MLSVATRPLLSAGLLAALLSSPLNASSAWASSEPGPRLLDVQARAEQQVVPDKATLSARLWERTPATAQRDDTQANPEALTKARTRLEERARNLIQRIEAAGLSRDAIKAGSLNIQPETIYEPSGKDAQQNTPMVRTRIERPFEIEITDLDKLPTILDSLTEAGVNVMDGISYDLTDRQAVSDETLTMALERARDKAELMSSTLGVTLGPVHGITEQQAPNYQPRMMSMASDAMENSGSAEYRPGTITLEATVNVSWEIGEQP